MWRHLPKHALWRNKQCYPRLTVYFHTFWYYWWVKLHKERQICFCLFSWETKFADPDRGRSLYELGIKFFIFFFIIFLGSKIGPNSVTEVLSTVANCRHYLTKPYVLSSKTNYTVLEYFNPNVTLVLYWFLAEWNRKYN